MTCRISCAASTQRVSIKGAVILLATCEGLSAGFVDLTHASPAHIVQDGNYEEIR